MQENGEVDTAETVDSLLQINNKSQAYKRPLTETRSYLLLLTKQHFSVFFVVFFCSLLEENQKINPAAGNFFKWVESKGKLFT